MHFFTSVSKVWHIVVAQKVLIEGRKDRTLRISSEAKHVVHLHPHFIVSGSSYAFSEFLVNWNALFFKLYIKWTVSIPRDFLTVGLGSKGRAPTSFITHFYFNLRTSIFIILQQFCWRKCPIALKIFCWSWIWWPVSIIWATWVAKIGGS